LHRWRGEEEKGKGEGGWERRRCEERAAHVDVDTSLSGEQRRSWRVDCGRKCPPSSRHVFANVPLCKGDSLSEVTVEETPRGECEDVKTLFPEAESIWFVFLYISVDC
jgi:hypothetical protein